MYSLLHNKTKAAAFHLSYVGRMYLLYNVSGVPNIIILLQ